MPKRTVAAAAEGLPDHMIPRDQTYRVISDARERLNGVARLVKAASLAVTGCAELGEPDDCDAVLRLLSIISAEIELVKAGVEEGANVLHVLAFPHRYPDSPYVANAPAKSAPRQTEAAS
jgi:hypothetical protein